MDGWMNEQMSGWMDGWMDGIIICNMQSVCHIQDIGSIFQRLESTFQRLESNF